MQYDAVMKNRLKRIEGQIRGLIHMMDEEKECKDIVTQMSAVRGALDHASAMIVSKHLEQCIRESKEEEQHAEGLVEEAVNLLIKSR